MKNYLLLFLLFISLSAVSQSPNHGRRGETLTTRITGPGAMLTISSGMGSSYLIYLTQGSYQINSTNYTLFPHVPYLGFADSLEATFSIPQSAAPGPYVLHVRSMFNNYDNITRSFYIEETLLEGNIYFDANQNGIRDTLENGMAFQSVRIDPGGTILQTDYTGKYRGQLGSGTFTDSILVPANFTLTTPSAFYTITLPPDDTMGNDFGLFTPADTVMVHNFISGTDPIRCNRPFNSFWQTTSLSNNIQTGTVTIICDSALTYAGALPIPDFISGDTLRWNYTLQPFESLEGKINFLGGFPSVTSGFIAYDTLNGANGNVYVQMDTIKEVVRCSYDPNDKRVEPAGEDSVFHYTELNAELKYFIRFQNCGTDTAYDVVIRDTMDMDLDLNTFELLYASSNVSVQREANRAMRFTFNNILLPDSNIDEPNSHGMIIYSISPKSTVTNNTLVKNRAYIYFDFNLPVVTNETFNTLVNPIPTEIHDPGSENNLLIFPNPITENSVIQLPDLSNYGLRIYDISGKQIVSEEIDSDFHLATVKFARGIYYYKLTDKKLGTVYSGKIVVVE
jgi:hypothetical protein